MNDTALAHDHDLIGEADRFVDVVGHKDDCLPEFLVDAPQLQLQVRAGDGIERAEWLVHQHGVGIHGQGARKSDPLLLATRELGRIAAPVGGRRQPD